MLAAKNISKQFGGIHALSGIDLELYPGQVNAIIGENGAGKSTLMKILSGVYNDYEGEIIYNGQVVRFSGPRDAEEKGIAIIHQELNLVPYLSITENIFLGREITNQFGMLDKKKMNAKAAGLLSKLNLELSPETKVAALRVGQQQLVEIAKALHAEAAVIIMDEPTSAISDKEVDSLFALVRQLRSEGKTIVYISHKLKELLTIADRYVVMRDGCVIGAGDMKTVSQEELIRQMTGRNIISEQTGHSPDGSRILLSVESMTLKHSFLPNVKVLSNVSFSLHEGEILGIYGLMGAGRTELMECIFGLHPKNAKGKITINGNETVIKSPADAIRAGIALVPEDRKLQGLILNQSISSNISMSILQKLERWGLMISRSKEKQVSARYINQLSIKTTSSEKRADQLSGGNQQKVVLAKWLATKPKILLLDEPTRGIDIHAKYDIYKLMKKLAAEGIGIVMVSSELPEILAVSDRVLVMCEGELTATFAIEQCSEATILKHAINKN
jgi:ribose transport system ATP-binding protein